MLRKILFGMLLLFIAAVLVPAAPALAQTGSISGTVVDSSGIPITNMEMAVQNPADGSSMGVNPVCTDANGNYTFSGLTGGTWVVYALGTDLACSGSATVSYAPEYYDGVYLRSEATPLTIVGDTTFTGIDFTLEQPGTITGNISAEGGGALENVQVFVAIEAADGSGSIYRQSECSDTNGDYTLNGLPIGRAFKVYASPSGSSCFPGSPPTQYAPEWWQEASGRSTATPLTISTEGGSIADIDFTLPLAGSISGIVYDLDGTTFLPDMRVEVINFDAGIFLSTCTAVMNGSYTITGITPGVPVKVYTGGPNNLCGGPFASGPTDYQQLWYNQQRDRNNADELTLTAGQTVTGIDFTMLPPQGISGTVIDDSNNQPIQNMAVYAQDTSFNPLDSTCTDNNGVYNMLNIPQDTDVYIYVDGTLGCGTDYNYARQYYDGVFEFFNATPLRLTAATPELQNIDFALQPGGTLTVNVTDADTNQPIEGVRIQVSAGQVDFRAVCSDASGQAVFTGLKQTVSYFVDAGTSFNRLAADGTACDANYVTSFLGGEVRTPVFFSSGNLTETVDLSLTAGTTITGNVAQADGSALPINTRGSLSLLDDQYQNIGFSTSDTNGDFVQYGVPPNSTVYMNAVALENSLGVTFGREYYNEKRVSADADAINTGAAGTDFANVNFTLGAVATITGTVYAADGVTPLVGVPVAINGGDARLRSCTSNDGSYTIFAATENESYTIAAGGDINAFCNDQTQPLVWYDGASDQSSATPVLGGASGIDFVMTAPTGTAPTITSIAPPNGTVGMAYTHNYTATGDTPITYSVSSGALPDGLTLTGDTISGTPTATGTFTGEVTATNAEGSDTQAFSIVVSDTPPASDVPTNLQPDGVTFDTNPSLPGFSWVGVDGAATYRLYVIDGNAQVTLDETFPAADICTGTSCTVATDDLLPYYGLLNGTYSWWVGAIMPNGDQFWSDAPTYNPATFDVSIPNAALPSNISVDIRTGRPLFTWDDDPNTLFIQMYIGNAGPASFFEWIERNGNPDDAVRDFICDGTTCTFDPEWDVVTGTYTAWMQAWGPGGFSTGGEGGSAWTSSPDFTLPTTAPDASMFSPTVNDYDGDEPILTWAGSGVATWYQIYVTTAGPDYSTLIYGSNTSWFNADQLDCDSGTTPDDCVLVIDGLSDSLTDGNEYAIWMQAWGPGGLSTNGVGGSAFAEGAFTYSPN